VVIKAEPTSPASPSKKKPAKIVFNLGYTVYDVIGKVAKKCLDMRLKEIEEDHEGRVIKGEGNQKLSPCWDISWHDGGVTADFLAKMLPYQKINHYPGMYCVTRKNHLARNLMRMKKAFP
jgi:tubulin polyglutamylase TTLL6/13